MVLEKIEVQGSFQDGISAGIQKTIDKMTEFKVSTDAVTQALERLNKAKDRNTKASQSAAQATADLVTSCRELEDVTKEQRVTLHKIEVQTERTGKAFVKAGESINDTFSNEVRSRIQNALDTMVEFGATIGDVEAASKKLNKAQMSGTRGQAQQANVLRTLVDESENAEFAMKNMGRATTIAAQAGIKLEDAGRQLGMAFRGDTTILKNFDEQAKRAAAAIEKINNPAKRQKLIMEELARAQRRVGSSLNRLQDSFAAADAKLSAVGLSVKKLAVGLGGLGLAAFTAGFALLTKSVEEYRKGSDLAIESTNALTMSIEQAQNKTGKAISDFLELDLLMLELSKSIDEASSANSLFGKELAGVALVIAGINALFKKLDKAIIGVTKQTEIGTAAQLSYVDVMQITIGLLSKATRETRRYEISQHNARMAARRRREEEAIALDKEDKQNEKNLKAANKAASAAEKALQAQSAKSSAPRRRRGGGGGRRARAAKPLEDFTTFGPTSAELGGTFQQTIDSLTGDGGMGAASEAYTKLQNALNQAMPSFDGLGERLRQQIDLTRQMKEGYKDAGSALTQFANGGVALASNSVSMLFENLAAGQDVLANFGTFLLQAMGDLLGQMGQAFIMLGAGFDNIKTGIMSPGALIAIGVGMVALSGALKGFASRSQAGGSANSAGGGTAQALERFGQRLFDRGDADQGREMTINIEGRSMRGFMLDVAADGARRGSVPLTPRRV